MGQPILVGHHSEGRHRAALARSDSAMRKSIEGQQDSAEYYERKAQGVGQGGISSDDPEAVAKLRTELEQLQKAQGVMKAGNKVVRASGGIRDDRGIGLRYLPFWPAGRSAAGVQQELCTRPRQR